MQEKMVRAKIYKLGSKAWKALKQKTKKRVKKLHLILLNYTPKGSKKLVLPYPEAIY